MKTKIVVLALVSTAFCCAAFYLWASNSRAEKDMLACQHMTVDDADNIVVNDLLSNAPAEVFNKSRVTIGSVDIEKSDIYTMNRRYYIVPFSMTGQASGQYMASFSCSDTQNIRFLRR